MPEIEDPITEPVPQEPVDTDPDDEMIPVEAAPSWPYDPATEGLADEEVQS